jgi:membrane-associated phospholipid phosphatase
MTRPATGDREALDRLARWRGRGRRLPGPSLLAVMVCVALSTTSLPAQSSDPPPDSPPYWRTNLFGRFFRDQKYLVTTWWPNEFRRPAFTGSILAGLALAADSRVSSGEGFDPEFEQYVKEESSGPVNRAWRRVSDLGNAATGVALIGTGYFIGRWSHHDRLAEASSLSAEALLSAGLYSSALKALSARTRPAGGGRGDFFEYRPPSGQVNGSFPSGHATGAFTVAAVFSGVYSDHRWVPWVAYGTAGLVGFSRISLGRHFPSDVLVGAILGHSIGRMVVSRRGGQGEAVSHIVPLVDLSRQDAGVVWIRRW